MVSKLSLFLATMQLSPAQLFPHCRQQHVGLLKEVAGDIPAAPCCKDILELWLEAFGMGGLIPGNAALFLIGFSLMVAADIFLHRWCGAALSLAAGPMSALHCLFKFRSSQPRITLPVGLFAPYWLLNGFWRSIAFAFLVYFTNMGAIFAQRR